SFIFAALICIFLPLPWKPAKLSRWRRREFPLPPSISASRDRALGGMCRICRSGGTIGKCEIVGRCGEVGRRQAIRRFVCGDAEYRAGRRSKTRNPEAEMDLRRFQKDARPIPPAEAAIGFHR